MRGRKLRRLAISMALAISCALLAPLVLAEASERPLDLEPLFGLLYDSKEVVFAKAPTEVFRCRDLKDPPRKLYLFGETAEKEKRFLYVYGLIQTETGAFEAESDDGLIVVLSPSACRNISAGYAMSPDETYRKKARKIGISDEVLNRLLNDAVEREVEAFGGAERFLRIIHAARLDESTLHPQLRAKLLSIRKETERHQNNK